MDHRLYFFEMNADRTSISETSSSSVSDSIATPPQASAISVPMSLEVELSHPLIGRARVLANELANDGLFVQLPAAKGFKVGTAVRISPYSHSLIESRPSPTVQMRVSRITQDGLELAFLNKSSAHLWKSVDFGNQELNLERDFFRLYHAAALQRPDGAVLLTQQNGRWLFPGHYLIAQQDWQVELQNFLQQCFSLTDCQLGQTLLVDSQAEIADGATATLFMLHRVSISERIVQLTANTPYARCYWAKTSRDIDELSFSSEKLRGAAQTMLAQKPAAPTAEAATPQTNSMSSKGQDPLLRSTQETISSLKHSKKSQPLASQTEATPNKATGTRKTE